MRKGIFIAATGQNVGKTTLCLGILSGLKKRKGSVGFLKPVGQMHATAADGSQADKDVILFKDHFHLQSSYISMSPVICPSGFTRDFLDHKVTEEALLDKILLSYKELRKKNDYVLVEGTGHIGVGSVFHLSNAKVAKALEMDVVIIATGGLGSAVDELALNLELCRSYGVTVRGVILNKVHDNKREMILEYVPKSLADFNIPLIGCIPYTPMLSIPLMKDFESLFHTTLLSGKEHRLRHFSDTRLVAGSLESYLEEMAPNQLVITPACREDIILAVIKRHKQERELTGIDYGSGMILTGKKELRNEILQQIQSSTIPVLRAPLCSFDAMKVLASFTAKIRNEDIAKVDKAIEIVENNIDFSLLL